MSIIKFDASIKGLFGTLDSALRPRPESLQVLEIVKYDLRSRNYQNNRYYV